MRILHITQAINDEQGGLTTALQHILSIEKQLGYASDILTTKNGSPNEVLILLSNKVFMFPTSFPHRFHRSSAALGWLKVNISSYDLVQIHSTWNFLVQESARLALKTGIPYTLWPHGSLDHFDLQKKKILKKILGPALIKRVLDKASGIIYTVDKEVEESENYGALVKPRILPLPVKIQVQDVGLENVNDFRKKFGIEQDDQLLLFLSRIDYKKGLNILIPVISKLVASYPKLKLMIAGSDSNGYLLKVNAWLKQYNLKQHVILPGFLSGQEKACAFQAAQCFVLPSKNENFGIAVVESLAYQLPVLISDQVYIHENIIRNKAGWVCKHNLESLYDTLAYILQNIEECTQMKDGCNRAYNTYDPFYLMPLYKGSYEEMTQ